MGSMRCDGGMDGLRLVGDGGNRGSGVGTVGNETVGEVSSGDGSVGDQTVGVGSVGVGGDGGGGNGGSSDGNLGNVLGDDGGGGVGGVGGVVNMGLLNDLLDGVDLVGGGDGDGPGDGDLVGLGNVLLDNDLTGNGNGDLNGDINVVLVDLELGHDLGLDGGDLSVGPDGGEDPLLGDGISGSGSKVPGCGGDSGGHGSSLGDNGGGQGTGLNQVLGLAGDVGVGGLGDHLLADLNVLVAGLDLLGADLDGPASNDAVLDMVLDNGGSGGVAVVGLSDGHRGGDMGGGGTVGQGSGGQAVGVGGLGSGGSVRDGNKGKGDLKKEKICLHIKNIKIGIHINQSVY